MVELIYTGRLGNNLFQYCFARIIAENLGYKLKTEPIVGFPATYENVEGKDYSSEDVNNIKGHFNNLEAIINNKTKRCIRLRGHFQKYRFYKNYKKIVRDHWLKTDFKTELTLSKDDIVVHVRRTDYVRRKEALPYSFFQDVLKKANYDKAYIVTDAPEDDFILKLRDEFSGIIAPGDLYEHFALIKDANKVVLSPSTFSWFAAFLSDAQEIYFPIPKSGFWSEKYPGVELHVDDEERYQYIECTEEFE